MSNFAKLDELLSKLVDDINLCRQELKSYQTVEASPEPAIELVPITFEEVRTRLAELSRDGKTAEVRELIAKFGATKLSEVDPKHYSAIMDGAVEIEHGRS
jgi:hypothetical protein